MFIRPSWDEYFLMIANVVALRGDCRRAQVGAVLVEESSRRQLSTGCNGVEPGRDGCLSGACPRGLLSFEDCPPGGDYSNCIAKHAERNCLEWWRDFGNIAFYDSTLLMYITRSPCDDCHELLKYYRVSKVIWPEGKMDVR